MRYSFFTLFLLGLILAFVYFSCTFNAEEDLYPNVVCDTTDVRFSSDIVPIFERHCLGCHNSISKQGNVSLSGHSDVVFHVQNGALLGSIRHESGWSPMPKGAPMLSDCDIKRIEVWIELGSPNN